MAGPMRIRAAAKEGVTEVRVLMSHPMETGQRKDSSGNIIPGHYITDLVAKHNDKVVLEAQMSGSVSTNPYLAFKFNGGAKGDKLMVSWTDNKGESRTDEVQVS
ncbi:MAG: thiosulfate oxidation carrier complex protein SoxZ [Rhodocyclaceae bacterium]|nr:thiosulfate oxidation carrier complex protein SoxZ [Rhodocyclaceae bacterium]